MSAESKNRVDVTMASLSGGLLAPVRHAAGAVVIAAGPWLVAVSALALVSLTMQPVLGFAAVEDLRLTVVYAFCIAPLVAAPIGVVAARQITTEAEAGRLERAPAFFLAAAILAGAGSLVLALLGVAVLGIVPVGVAAGFVFLSMAAALLWTSFAVMTALRAYSFLILAFAGGMAVAVAFVMTAAAFGRVTNTVILIWPFTAGFGLTGCLSLAWLRREAECVQEDVIGAGRAILVQIGRQRSLCLGVIFAIAAVWVDKWFYWVAPTGVSSMAGYRHYAPFDSVMFVAHLSAIPTYAAMLIFHDGTLRERVEAFRTQLQRGATFTQIRATIEAMTHAVWSGLFTIVLLQGALTACLVLMAPAVASWLWLSFDQLLMLRVALIGVFLHAFFHLGSSILLVCNRTRVFALLQGMFLALNASASIFLYLGFGVTAYSFFLSALIASIVCFFLAFRALNELDFLTFIAENDGLYGS